MTDGPRLPDEPDLEHLLVRARPRPSEEFVAATERRLLGRAPARRTSRRTMVAGLGLTGALAATLLVTVLVGAGPLAPGGSEDVRARQDCRTTTVVRTQPEGEIVLKDGTPTVVEREQRVARTVQDCR